MKRDPLDDFAQHLFAAAREEEPDTALLERVLGLDPTSVDHAETARPSVTKHERPPLRSRRSFDARRWLLAAAVLGAIAGVGWLTTNGRESPPLAISPEAPRRASDVPAPPREPAAPEPALPSASPRPAEPGLLPSPPAPRPSSPRREPPERQAPRAAPAPLPLSGELGLLKQAREAMRQGSPDRALGLLDRYAAEHGTALVDEAALLRIETLSALNRKDEARTLALRFVAENPDSPLFDRARRYVDAGAHDVAR